MKVVRQNNTYNIYEDDMETLTELPVAVYGIRYNPDMGWYLVRQNDPVLTEKKIYGVHEEKVAKVLSSFEKINRNLGVLLSGDKGIGKSLFIKLFCFKAMERGIPVIRVDAGINVSDFIESIQQEVLVVFDEFDKNFSNLENQDRLLSLFDGMLSGKKMFAIVCNDTRKLSEFLLGRPGRFHYHFKFEYPGLADAKEYLEDNVLPEYQGEVEIASVYAFLYNYSYDALRSIVFELNTGAKFLHVLPDLNINKKARKSLTMLFYEGEDLIYVSNQVKVDITGKVAYLGVRVLSMADTVCSVDRKDSITGSVNLQNFKTCTHGVFWECEEPFNIDGHDITKVVLCIAKLTYVDDVKG